MSELFRSTKLREVKLWNCVGRWRLHAFFSHCNPIKVTPLRSCRRTLSFSSFMTKKDFNKVCYKLPLDYLSSISENYNKIESVRRVTETIVRIGPVSPPVRDSKHRNTMLTSENNAHNNSISWKWGSRVSTTNGRRINPAWSGIYTGNYACCMSWGRAEN